MTVQYSRPLPIAEVKAVGDAWECSGYLSTFGSVDRTGDTILAGAFDEALSDGRKIKFLFAHDQSQVLGVPLALKTDDHGLFGRFRISRTRLGEDVHTLLVDGALDSFSIGFFIDDLDFDPETGTRILKSIDLLEASVVAVPANPEAVVTNVKAGPAARLTMDEEAQAVLASFQAFTDRCSDVASLRAGDGRMPSGVFFTRLASVRAAADELLALKERAATPTPPREESAPQSDPAQEPPPAVGDSVPTTSASPSGAALSLALKRRRLVHAGILERPREHDGSRGPQRDQVAV